MKRKKRTMNNVFKSSPNQKTITVKKEQCDKQNYYAAINLKALESAATQLKSGAFKLWIYFAKNQNNFSFALSNKVIDPGINFSIIFFAMSLISTMSLI